MCNYRPLLPHQYREEFQIVEYLMFSIVVFILGVAAVVTFLAMALPRARRLRDTARKRGELGSEEDLEKFINQVDQAETGEDLDRLDTKKEDRLCSS